MIGGTACKGHIATDAGAPTTPGHNGDIHSLNWKMQFNRK